MTVNVFPVGETIIHPFHPNHPPPQVNEREPQAAFEFHPVHPFPALLITCQVPVREEVSRKIIHPLPPPPPPPPPSACQFVAAAVAFHPFPPFPPIICIKLLLIIAFADMNIHHPPFHPLPPPPLCQLLTEHHPPPPLELEY